ncbi:alpha/beta hydrolase family protein [Butyrivibrio sp. AE2032]|uniref:alpha/beta hydrolase family protein n=1 Tax=Butyrivibrio sp. AE2032 TaxID=1458463 RepID=UPI00068E9C45|nr:alpha/beta hydrolase [Butyrivibrio sp. AE2032]
MEKKYGATQETLEVVKDNGKMIRGVIVRPDGDGEKYPAAIFSHGFGSNYSELIHHGTGYAENGIVCVFFDFCGGGEESTSDGTMLEMTVLTEADDLEAVMDTVLELPYVDRDALYLQGESQGGFVSAIVGDRRKEDVKGLLLWYPAFVIPDDSKERFKAGITNVFGHELSDAYDKVAKDIDVNILQRNFGKPVLLIHGDKDDVVPIEYSRTAAANYGYATLREIQGAGHGFNGQDSDDAREMSIAFIKIYESVTDLKLE